MYAFVVAYHPLRRYLDTTDCKYEKNKKQANKKISHNAAIY